MFFSIVKWVLISLTLIFLVHHLYMFLMNTLTVPKIKDLVNKPTQQYQAIFETIEQAKNGPVMHGAAMHGAAMHANANANALVPSMTDELSSFLSELKKAPAQAVQAQQQQQAQQQAQHTVQASDVTDINSLPMYSPY
jgi:hypothetical protein